MRIDLPGYGTATTPDYPPATPCAICGEDGIDLDDLCRCAECAPQGEETAEEWEVRVAPRRRR